MSRFGYCSKSDRLGDYSAPSIEAVLGASEVNPGPGVDTEAEDDAVALPVVVGGAMRFLQTSLVGFMLSIFGF